MKRILSMLLVVVMITSLVACSSPEQPTSEQPTSAQPNNSSQEEVKETDWREDYAYMVGKQALIYGYPVVKYGSVAYDWVEGHSDVFRTSVNTYMHTPKLLGPEYQKGTSMNRDTLYSIGFCYLGDEPLIFTIGDNPDGRYYSIEFTDWYSDCFGYMGTRTTNNKAAAYLVHAPGWKGEIPKGIDKVVESPTPYIMAVGRTFTTNTEEDLKIANKMQKDYKIFPLSEWGKPNAKEAAPINDLPDPFPKDDPLGFFKFMNVWMKLVPPSERDRALMENYALVGLGSLAEGNLDDLDESTKRGLERAIVDGLQFLQKTSEAVGSILNLNKTVNGWSYNPQNWGRMGDTADFLGRSATQCYSGGTENLVEECVKLRVFTDQNGNNLNGSQKYVLKFDKDQIPVVGAFWSVTLYNNEFNVVENDLKKYAIRDIDPDLKYGEDGSLTIYLQSTPPSDPNGNWLPTPSDMDFNLFFRAYLPNQDFIDQSYIPPSIELLE